MLGSGGKLEYSKRRVIYSHMCGLLFAMMIACGRSLDSYGNISFKNILLPVILYTHVIAELLSLLWESLIRMERKLEELKTVKIIDRITGWLLDHPYMITVLLISFWLPCFIADFPGGFRYDATGELNQMTKGYNGNYPLLHSAVITWLLPFLYNITGSYNTGVAVYVSVQMIMIACMYTHIICFFGHKISRLLTFVIMLYCSFFPVIQILVVQEVRDVLFSALFMYAVFLFCIMCCDTRNFFTGIFKPVLLGIVFVLALLARNNNTGMVMLIAVLVAGLVVVLVNRKHCLKGSICFLVTSVISYLITGFVLTSICQPLKPATEGASLSLFSQSLARAYLYDSDKWTDQEVEELGKYLELKDLGYYPENADPTKSKLKIKGNLADFLRFWHRTGLKHAGCYIDAILANTQNMWYPDSVIDGYKQRFKKKGQPYYEFDKNYYSISAKLEKPIVHMNYLPAVLNYYTQIGLYISFEKIPVVSMLFSIGFQFWIVINNFFYIIYRRQRHILIPLSLIMAYMMISAFVPLILLRYFAAVFFCFPMLLVFTLEPNHISEHGIMYY